MSLARVEVAQDTFFACLSHALSTDKEEIMGLLFGDTYEEPTEDGGIELVCRIWAAVPQTRADRRKDRVETTPEQLAQASQEAERQTHASGVTTRVIGWYHSHPHITVLPSHVDTRTQAQYQMLDLGFVGLIFSCFDENASNVGRLQAIAFQSVRQDDSAGGGYAHRQIPMAVTPAKPPKGAAPPMDPVLAVQRTLMSEETAVYQAASTSAAESGDLLGAVQAASTFQCTVCKLAELSLGPLISALRHRAAQESVQGTLGVRQEADLISAVRGQGLEPVARSVSATS